MIWVLVAGACLIVAAAYGVFWPRPKPGTVRPLWRHIVLRWGHTAVWVVLALSFFLRSLDADGLVGQANIVALVGGLLYTVFIATAFTDRAQDAR